MRENDDKLREYLESEDIPEQLSPDNVKKMLDEKAPAKKRRGISMAGKITAGVAACAVITGTCLGTAHLMRRGNSLFDGVHNLDVSEASMEENNCESADEDTDRSYVEAPYMNGAASYEQVYQLMKSSADKYEKQIRTYSNSRKNADYAIGAVEEEAGEVYDGEMSEAYAEEYDGIGSVDMQQNEDYLFEDNDTFTASTGETEYEESVSEEAPEHSETYDQEEGVREADIVKTDGKNIYYVWNAYGDMFSSKLYGGNAPVLDIASAADGEFIGHSWIDLTPDLSGMEQEGYITNVNVFDMYLYNDMIAVIGTAYSYCDTYTLYGDEYVFSDYTEYFYDEKNQTFVSFYTAGEEPQLIGTYFQEGSYSDVRIAPDGYMYLVSNYTSAEFDRLESEEDIERFIPSCGIDEDVECLPPEDILMPVGEPEAVKWLNYTVISGIDLNTPGQFSAVDTKALAGFTGALYSSADNIYVTSGWEDTDITRIAVGGGSITPAASGTVEGRVKDQFSMSEYGGYFRVASTVDKWEDNSTFFSDLFGIDRGSGFIRNNGVYVLDMDMNIVGSVTGFGENETIKSVNFSGNIGYVVTYEQTDPLFAIDLSDPAAPFITDEFKINGYSTYMQQWSDGLLLGFGVNADNDGIETGVKLVMFDNSDPNDLKEVGFFSIDRGENEWLYSDAVWERKELLIAPEKNLIGFPVYRYSYGSENDYYESYSAEIKYVFFSYEDGEFVQRGEIAEDMGNGSYDPGTIYNRALYIGDYVYVLSGSKFVSADIADITVKDQIVFE